ncbi:MAG: PilZ domain-containing protein [Aquificae bacterium]|nr:PilZ domain-containing protein [Aquificota bacterium]
MGPCVEIYLLNDDTVVYVKTDLEKFDGSAIHVKATPLLKKYGRVGDRVHFRYDSFVLPTRIIGVGEDYYLLEFPTLHPEKPVGERRSIRVRVPQRSPIKVNLEGIEKEMHDISETGFSVFCNLEELDEIANPSKTLEVSFTLPNIEEEIRGTARIANIREVERGKILCGYELFLEDPDMVKVRFYIYERIKEILQGKE